MDDHALLQDYARNRSQEAFRQLVDRHLRMVYGAAHRIVRDAHLAEEVAQNVFTLLAAKAAGIVPPQVVAGWLYNSTRHLAMHCVRSEQRRREREETAAAMHLNVSEPDPAWIAGHLEEALAELEADDRDALVLRYLEERNLGDVGRELGVSEDAARMRVNRAMDRIRLVFQRRGGAVTAVGLAAAISTATAVPTTALAISVTAAAVASTTVTTITATTASIMSLKTIVAVVAAAGLTGVGTYLVQQKKVDVSQARAIQMASLVEGISGETNAWAARLALQAAEMRRLKELEATVLRSFATTGSNTARPATARPSLPPAAPSVDPVDAELEEAFAEARIMRMKHGRSWALAFMEFSEANKGQLPGAFDLASVHLSDHPDRQALTNASSSFEIVSSGSLVDMLEPSKTILFRDKTSYARFQKPGFERIYVFADGHAEVATSSDQNFSEYEKKLIQPKK